MTLLKQTLAILGTVLTIAIIVAIVSPKTAHAVAAALVQIEPGATTHLGQNETQLVSLSCQYVYGGCAAINPQGVYSATAYTVPAGYTLIVTDWQFFYFGSKETPGAAYGDSLSSVQNSLAFVTAFAVADVNGRAAANIKFTNGIRYGSGMTVTDYYSSENQGFAFIQGYLVPN